MSFYQTIISQKTFELALNMSEKLCLKWNDFQENTSSAFAVLRDDRDLSDVTLVCEDGQQIEAHKVILAASSPFFLELLKRNKHPHALLYMRGVKYEILGALVDFLYLGEADVFQDQLDDFLAVAEDLRLKGLTGKTEGKGSPVFEAQKQQEKVKQGVFHPPPVQKKIKTFPETRIALAANELRGDADLQQLDEQIKSMMDFSDLKPRKGQGRARICKICGKEGEIQNIKSHIEANHITGIEHPCELCGKTSRSRQGLRMHKATQHQNS